MSVTDDTATRRTVPEWVGSSPDAAIPKHVRLRIWDRCGGRCALTGKKLIPGDDFDFDHITALRDGGRHAEFNLQLVWRPAHREKTAREAGERAKADRIRAKHNGIWPASKSRLQGRPFPRTRPGIGGKPQP